MSTTKAKVSPTIISVLLKALRTILGRKAGSIALTNWDLRISQKHIVIICIRGLLAVLTKRWVVSRKALVLPSRSWSSVWDGYLPRIPDIITYHWAAVAARVPCNGHPRKITPEVAMSSSRYALSCMLAISSAYICHQLSARIFWRYDNLTLVTTRPPKHEATNIRGLEDESFCNRVRLSLRMAAVALPLLCGAAGCLTVCRRRWLF